MSKVKKIIYILVLINMSAYSYSFEPPDPRMGKIMDEKARAMRERIQNDFENQNYEPLLMKKESVDSFVLPMLLPYEMDSPNLDLCRIMRYDYKNTSTVCTIPDGYHSKFFTSVYSVGDIESDQCILYDLRMTRYHHIGLDYPVSLNGMVKLTKQSCECFIDWHEPFLANRDLDFPVHPERYLYGWNQDKLFSWPQVTNSEPVYDQIMDVYPVFQSVSTVYGFIGSMRMKNAIITNNVENIKVSKNKNIKIYGADDNALLREISINQTSHNSYVMTIDQKKIGLKLQSPSIFTIQKQVSHRNTGSEKFIPAVNLDYLKNGRQIKIEFMNVKKLNDHLFPRTVIINNGTTKTYEASFTNIRKIKKVDAPQLKKISYEIMKMRNMYNKVKNRDLIDKSTYYTMTTLEDTSDSLKYRQQVKYNVFCAAYMKDWDILDETLLNYQKRLASEGYGADVYIYNLESVTTMSFVFYGEQSGMRVALKNMADAYRMCNSEDLRRHVVRLLEQYRLGYALIAINAMSGAQNNNMEDAKWAEMMRVKINAIMSGKGTEYKKPDVLDMDKLEKINAAICKKYVGN